MLVRTSRARHPAACAIGAAAVPSIAGSVIVGIGNRPSNDDGPSPVGKDSRNGRDLAVVRLQTVFLTPR